MFRSTFRPLPIKSYTYLQTYEMEEPLINARSFRTRTHQNGGFLSGMLKELPWSQDVQISLGSEEAAPWVWHA